jgi:hypothetical protein
MLAIEFRASSDFVPFRIFTELESSRYKQGSGGIRTQNFGELEVMRTRLAFFVGCEPTDIWLIQAKEKLVLTWTWSRPDPPGLAVVLRQ